MRIKWVVILLLFFLVPLQAFAVVATFRVAGSVVDSKNSHISGATITYEDAKGKVIMSGASDLNGTYSILVPEGTYTVVVSPPKGVSAPKVINQGKIVSGDSTQDYTLATPVQNTNSQPTQTRGGVQGIAIYIVSGILILLACVFGYIFLSGKRKSNNHSRDQASTLSD